MKHFPGDPLSAPTSPFLKNADLLLKEAILHGV